MKLQMNDQVGLVGDYWPATDGRPTAVLLPGLAESRWIWTAQIDWLTQAGWGVLTFDYRNQGDSQRTIKGQRVSRYAQDLYQWCTQLQISQPVLIGHSLGAAVAFAYVGLYGSHRVASIIDIDQSPRMLNDSEWAYGFRDLTPDTFPLLLQQPFGSPTLHGVDAAIRQVLQEHLPKFSYDWSHNLPLLYDHAIQDWRDIIAYLTCPLTIIVGEDSPFFNWHFAEPMAQLAPHGATFKMSGVGHLPFAEQPEQFNRLLARILKIGTS